jgi:hypothetical protein
VGLVYRADAAEQCEPERRGDHYGQQPGGHQACGASAGDDPELKADLRRGHDEGQRCGLQDARDQRAREAKGMHVDQRREAPREEDRKQEQRHAGNGGAAREQCAQIEAQSAGDEEDRDEHPEADRLKLKPELGMGRRLIPVEQREQHSGGERAEDRLKADALGQHGEPDQQQECRTHADLRGGVLKAPQHS